MEKVIVLLQDQRFAGITMKFKIRLFPFALPRSSIQVSELVCKNGTLTCNRDEPFDFWTPDVK